MNNHEPTLPDVQHWINGAEFREAGSETFESRNPLNDQCLARIAKGTPATIDQAVEVAHEAFLSFRHTPVQEKEKWLLKAADCLNQNSDRLVQLLIDEIGSPLSKARKELAVATGILRASAGAARRVHGKTYPSETPGRFSYSMRQPLGVVAGMTPFNVPLIKAIKASAMPLATGNAVVLLPSEETAILSAEIGQIYQKAGLPDGAFNVVHGSGYEIGDSLTTHPLVKAVCFTGSHRVGKHVQKLCGEQGKRVLLELGGKNPVVILKDADLKKAIPGCVLGAFLFQGQICMSSSRIYVETEIAESFTEGFAAAAGRIQCGDLQDPKTMVGPIINERQRTRIKNHIEDALSKGARLLTGNEWNGNVLSPTVLADVTPDMQIHYEETFGPVTTIYTVPDSEAALQGANDSAFGLSGAVYTNQLDQAMEFANRMRAGMVHINGSTIQDEPHVPFGGVGQSGFGREGADVAIDELTEWKWVTIQP